MKIGLLFGSFNPLHNGHLAVARFFAQQTDLDSVWLVVTPQNPLKDAQGLMPDQKRLSLVEKVTAQDPLLECCRVEFDRPAPHYTYDTLHHLKQQQPEHQWVLLMGSDLLAELPHWKNYTQLLEEFQIYVYPRPSLKKTEKVIAEHPHVHYFQAPLMDISATQIRAKIEQGMSVAKEVPEAILSYIKD